MTSTDACTHGPRQWIVRGYIARMERDAAMKLFVRRFSLFVEYALKVGICPIQKIGNIYHQWRILLVLKTVVLPLWRELILIGTEQMKPVSLHSLLVLMIRKILRLGVLDIRQIFGCLMEKKMMRITMFRFLLNMRILLECIIMEGFMAKVIKNTSHIPSAACRMIDSTKF